MGEKHGFSLRKTLQMSENETIRIIILRKVDE
jgi:hypothetical protein